MSDSPIDSAVVDGVLEEFADPETGRNLKHMQQVVDVSIAGNQLQVTIGLTTYSAPLWDETRERLEDQLRA